MNRRLRDLVVNINESVVCWAPLSHNCSMPELDSAIRAYYERGNEIDRFSPSSPSGPLEFQRTTEILTRYLPPPPLKILDVGGGPGAYAAWLVDRGYSVHVVDPVLLHVNQARSANPGVSAAVGDARELAQSDASIDAVLLLGPLYHLIERQDRIQALSEARRVLRPGGWIFAAAISRYAALLDLLVRAGRLHEPNVFQTVKSGIEAGVFQGTQGDLFTTSYFHLPQELANEIDTAGLELSAMLGIEGPGFLLRDFESDWKDPLKRETVLQTARLVEEIPEMLVCSSHMLAVARKSWG
jgi:SAM-dependent methyltransferase